MSNRKEFLVEWLRDVHAAEEQAKTALTALAGKVKDYPDLQQVVEDHLEQTMKHTKLVHACLTRLGGSSSTLKDTSGKLLATAQSLGGYLAGDEVIKAIMAAYTFESMEVASYQILISTAASIGDRETENICREILAEEEAMAQWLHEHIPGLTQNFLLRQADVATAR